MKTITLDPFGTAAFWTSGRLRRPEVVAALEGWPRLDKTAPIPLRTWPGALRDALTIHAKQYYSGRKVLIRNLKDRQGLELVQEDAGDKRNEYRHIMSAWFEQSSRNIDTDTTNEKQTEIESDMHEARDMMSADNTTYLLTSMLGACDGWSLKSTGGIYYVPEASSADWTDGAQRIEALDGPVSVTSFAMNRTAEAEAKVSATMTAALLAEMAEIRENVEAAEPPSGATTSKRYTSAKKEARRRLNDIERRAAEYVDILSTSLSTVTAELNRTDAALDTAALDALVDL